MVKKAPKQQKNITLEAVSEEKKGEGWGHFFRHLGHDVKKVGRKIANSKPVKTLAKDVVPAAIGIAVGAETENPYAGLAAQEAAQQGVNKAYSGKGTGNMKTIGIKASDKQLSKLRNGHAVRLLPGVTRQLVVDEKLHAKMSKAFAKKKGINVKLSKELIEAQKSMSGEGIFSKKNLKKGLKAVGKEALKEVKKEAKKGLNKLADVAGDAVIAELGPLGVPIASVGKRVLKKSGNKAIDNIDKKPKKKRATQASSAAPLPTERIQDASIEDLESAIRRKRKSLGLNGTSARLSGTSGANDDVMGNSYGEGLFAGGKQPISGQGLYAGKRGSGLYAGHGVSNQTEFGGYNIRGSLRGNHPAYMSPPPDQIKGIWKYTLKPSI